MKNVFKATVPAISWCTSQLCHGLGHSVEISPDSAAVRQAVAALPEIFREVVVFRYFEDLTVPEIAQVLDLPEGSVKSRLNRAKQRIRAALSPMTLTPTPKGVFSSSDSGNHEQTPTDANTGKPR